MKDTSPYIRLHIFEALPYLCVSTAAFFPMIRCVSERYFLFYRCQTINHNMPTGEAGNIYLVQYMQQIKHTQTHTNTTNAGPRFNQYIDYTPANMAEKKQKKTMLLPQGLLCKANPAECKTNAVPSVHIINPANHTSTRYSGV